MPQCKYYEVCHLNDDADPETGSCILHSENPEKDSQAFAVALDVHRKENGDNFTAFVFPADINFSGATFSHRANFSRATFTRTVNFGGATFTKTAFFDATTFTDTEPADFEPADFAEATFSQGAIFGGATFTRTVNFSRAMFSQGAIFGGATFTRIAIFGGATFTQGANLSGATFTRTADFSRTTFLGGANFNRTLFKGENADFSRSRFQGRALFASERQDSGQTVPIFSEAEVDFRQAVIEPLDALTFRDADLRKCRFQDTDLRKAEITGASWPRIGSRFGVYDEVAMSEKGDARALSRIERLYRELKQNYEDRRDYERAGDFHYGEKEMRRKNKKQTLPALRFFLTFYWLVSGYGERYLRPLVWAGVLSLVSTYLYLWLGLRSAGWNVRLSLTDVHDWLQAAHYSFRVMTLLKTDVVATPIGYARVVNTIQSLLGPQFLGLFALAVRQRLKR